MIKLRELRLSDLSQLREIASTAFKQHRFWIDLKLDREKVKEYYVRELEKLVRDTIENPEENDFIVATDDEEVIGYIALRIDRLLTTIFGFKWGVIASFALREDRRHKRIGSRMLGEAVTWFKSKGVSRVDVWTDSENIAAIQCYEKSGFRTIYSGVALTLDLSS